MAASVLAAAIGVASPVELAAQLQQAFVAVVVTDDARRPLAGAHVRLTDPLGHEVASGVSDAEGRVSFAGVVPGRYLLTAAADGRTPIRLPLTVLHALPIERDVQMLPLVAEHVVVRSGSSPEPSWRGSLSAAAMTRVPVRSAPGALQAIVATLPGWATEDNGLLHSRGVDDGFLYVVDGVPVYERLDVLSGLAPDVESIASLNAITGYVPPEFGHKAGGVIELRSAPARGWGGGGHAAFGGDAARQGGVSLDARLGSRAGLRLDAAALRSDRFLDPIHPDNLHNEGRQVSVSGQFEWAAARDRVSAGWGAGRSAFDVPHHDLQEDAGQDQRQRLGLGHGSLTWQRTWSSRFVTQASVYHRRSTARLSGSPRDVPLQADADRALVRSGVMGTATRHQGAHILKAGVEWQRLAIDEFFRFAVTDADAAEDAGYRDAALQFTPSRPFVFAGAASPALVSLFVQDEWQAGARLTISGGVRFDRSTLLLTRTQWSPRMGAAFQAGSRTVLRASVSRFFQPPQPENLLLSSSPEARLLSDLAVDGVEGGAEVEPERQWALEIGGSHQAGPVRLDAAYWRRAVRHAADPNVLAGSTIVFPNAVARGRAHGVDVRLEAPLMSGWSGYVNAAAGRVVQEGPVTGGLFLEDDVEELGPGVEFQPDHDQRLTAGGGITWEHVRTGAAATLTVRYETGTPIQQDDDDLDELLEQPGADRIDVEAMRVRPRTVVSVKFATPVVRSAAMRVLAEFQVVNLFDATYAYNFGNPFSGTHFGAPRTAAVGLRLQFR